jgi:hypothetical protein
MKNLEKGLLDLVNFYSKNFLENLKTFSYICINTNNEKNENN